MIFTARYPYALAAALTLALAACSEDSLSPADIAGLYSLTLVDGAELPATIDSTAVAVIEILAGSLSIDGATGYNLGVSVRERPPGGDGTPVVFLDFGDLEVTGDNTVRLHSIGGSTWTAIVAGTTIRVAVIVPPASSQALELTYAR